MACRRSPRPAQCAATKRWLNQRGVTYVEHDADLGSAVTIFAIFIAFLLIARLRERKTDMRSGTCGLNAHEYCTDEACTCACHTHENVREKVAA